MIKKTFCLFLFILLCQNFSFAITLDEVNLPAPHSSRMGIGNTPENILEVKAVDKKDIQKAQITKQEEPLNVIPKNIEEAQTYADLSLKRIAQDIADDTKEEMPDILGDLSVLWVYTAQNSETIQYTIYKLSNPDEDKPNDTILKKIIRPVASFSSIAGTAFSSNPFVASGALIGGNLLGALTSDDRQANYQFSKVTDANMVVLVRKIDDLQKKLLVLYVDYKTKQKIYNMAVENALKREKLFNEMQDKTKEEILLADVYYRNSQNALTKAKNDYFASRNILKQLVGDKALDEIENPKNELLE